VFILALATICFVFAKEARLHGSRAPPVSTELAELRSSRGGVGGPRHDPRRRVLRPDTLYVGEVVYVYAFGASWIGKGSDLLKGQFCGGVSFRAEELRLPDQAFNHSYSAGPSQTICGLPDARSEADPRIYCSITDWRILFNECWFRRHVRASCCLLGNLAAGS